MTGIERFCEILDAPVDITDAPDAVPLKVKEGEIAFEDVTFEYPDDHNRVLRHLNLRIRPGENLALVGPSGGGKTTICNLIPRFYDVTDGRILVDGQDVRKVTLYLDDAFGDGLIGIHPNDNTATVWLKSGDLVRIIEEHGNPVNVISIGD